MARANYPQRNNFGNSRPVFDPSSTANLHRVLHQLLMSSNTQYPAFEEVKRKLILPFARDDTEVSFVNHYGDVYKGKFFYSPKVMNYDYSLSEKEKTRTKIETAIREVTATMHQLDAGEHGSIDLDFPKLVFTDPKPPHIPRDSLSASELIEQFDANSGLIQYSIHRMCLPDGEQILLDLLQQEGVVIEEIKKKQDNLKLDMFGYRGFEYQGQVLSAFFELNSSDLSFRKWDNFYWLSNSYIFPNPGQESGREFQTEGGDLRIEGQITYKEKKCDLEARSQTLGLEFPSELSSPNLGGVLKRADGGFQVLEDSGIKHLYDCTNRVKYVMVKDDVRFKMIADDAIYYRYDVRNKTFIEERTRKRGIRLAFSVPSRDSSEIESHVSVLTDIVMKMLHFLGSGSIIPKMWSINFWLRGTSTSSLVFQRLRRRIIENEDLTAMLDLPTDALQNEITERLHRLLDALDERRVVLPWSERRKLEDAGRQAGIL